MTDGEVSSTLQPLLCLKVYPSFDIGKEERLLMFTLSQLYHFQLRNFLRLQLSHLPLALLLGRIVGAALLAPRLGRGGTHRLVGISNRLGTIGVAFCVLINRLSCRIRWRCHCFCACCCGICCRCWRCLHLYLWCYCYCCCCSNRCSGWCCCRCWYCCGC